jgi:hypothetical protein
MFQEGLTGTEVSIRLSVEFMATPENETPERRMSTRPPPRPLPLRSRLKKTLPTDRLSVPKQLDILRAYGASFESTGAPVTNDAVAEIVELAPTTVSLSNAFLVDVGLIQRGDAGYTPSPEVVAFCHAFGWDEEKASHKLAPLLIKTWFAQALIPKLKFRPLKSDEALRILAEVSSADKDYTAQLQMLLGFLDLTGIVVCENGEIRLNRETGETEKTITPPGAEATPTVEQVTTAFAQKNATSAGLSAGAINFEIKVNVGMAELSGWSADRITAFFSGVAKVMAAKADAENGKTE